MRLPREGSSHGKRPKTREKRKFIDTKQCKNPIDNTKSDNFNEK